MFNEIYIKATQQNTNAIARCISLIENEAEGYLQILENLPNTNVPIIGITGPPGAGKSTLTDQLINTIIEDKKKVAVLCIDPSSPFHHGALLGDRIRMNRWYNNDNVFIRSLASKATLGGLSPKVIEITDFLKSLHYDYVIVETIGVGQNEVEIASLADVTVVVLVPEGGDEIQTMKAGLMEVGNLFVVNKCDRKGADTFVKHLNNMLTPGFTKSENYIKVLKTIANKNEGIEALYLVIKSTIKDNLFLNNKLLLITERVYQLLIKKRMLDINKVELKNKIEQKIIEGDFNTYNFLKNIT